MAVDPTETTACEAVQKAMPTSRDGGITQRSRHPSHRHGVFKSWGAISGAVRSARAKAGALKIKDRWGHPSSKSMRDRWGMPWLDVWPTPVLLAEGDLSMSAAKRYIGMTRERAQEIFRAAEEKARIYRPRGRLQTVQKPPGCGGG